MLRNLLILSSLFLLSSCIFLSRSAIINHDPQDEVISIMSLEIIYDGKVEKRDRGIGGFCQMLFHDSEINLIKFRREKNTSFYMLKSEPGRIMADRLNCMHHIIPLLYLKHRRADLTYWAYLAHPGYINYLGHIIINYKPSPFGLRDIFALGGLKYDTVGTLDVRVEDRIEDAAKFLNKNYPELKNIPITKSFLDDIVKLKPDTKPEAYVPTANQLINAPTPPVSPVSTSEPTQIIQSANPYYTPYQHPQTIPYYNPYENQGPVVPVNR